ncbi:MAG TPA: hypothetical protein VFD27_07065 [Chthoniobacteraceae bacterium]|jgi:hypothetical protein|nr:hypothetical protein [Chthoniobacteraceae bacterium]
MEVATYILFVLGCLGATDILLYHSVSHGIRSRQDSRFELMVHSLRGPTYAALFVLVPNFAMQGGFFWLLVGIFAFDVCISLGDFMIERASREFFGGLPTGEYVLHIILAMLFGALVTSVFYSAGNWAGMPTRLAYEPAAVPGLLRAVMVFMAVLVMGSGVMDLLAARRLTKEVIPDH